MSASASAADADASLGGRPMRPRVVVLALLPVAVVVVFVAAALRGLPLVAASGMTALALLRGLPTRPLFTRFIVGFSVFVALFVAVFPSLLRGLPRPRYVLVPAPTSSLVSFSSGAVAVFLGLVRAAGAALGATSLGSVGLSALRLLRGDTTGPSPSSAAMSSIAVLFFGRPGSDFLVGVEGTAEGSGMLRLAFLGGRPRPRLTGEAEVEMRAIVFVLCCVVFREVR